MMCKFCLERAVDEGADCRMREMTGRSLTGNKVDVNQLHRVQCRIRSTKKAQFRFNRRQSPALYAYCAEGTIRLLYKVEGS